jgi:hypothetical protein
VFEWQSPRGDARRERSYYVGQLNWAERVAGTALCTIDRKIGIAEHVSSVIALAPQDGTGGFGGSNMAPVGEALRWGCPRSTVERQNYSAMIGEIYTVRRPILALLSIALACIVSTDCRAVETANVINLPPTAAQWADLAKLPDWSGTWMPLIRDQEAQVRTNPPPWTPKAAAQVLQMFAEEKAGHPRPLFVECLPEAMPSWMLITHNALEFLFTPGRVTILGESDGNRLRRIYTDGRDHPEDPDPTFHGHSIGHWEGETLVVDTVGILPQSYLAVSEAVGVPNNGDMHVIERIHLKGTDFLHDDLEIIAPKILTAPWKTTRIFFRQRERKYEFVEGNCLQESFVEGVDQDGNAAFIPVPHHKGGNLVAPK